MYDEQFKKGCLTGSGALERQWKHWGRKAVNASHTVGSYVGSPFVRCVKEGAFKSRLEKVV